MRRGENCCGYATKWERGANELANKRIKLMRRRSSSPWEHCAHSLCAVRWADSQGGA
jgi:hypothetical protein